MSILSAFVLGGGDVLSGDFVLGFYVWLYKFADLYMYSFFYWSKDPLSYYLSVLEELSNSCPEKYSLHLPQLASGIFFQLSVQMLS